MWFSAFGDFQLGQPLIGLGVPMPMPLTILGVFGGFIAYGFLGLFIGPTLNAVAFVLLEAWRARVRGTPTSLAVGWALEPRMRRNRSHGQGYRPDGSDLRFVRAIRCR